MIEINLIPQIKREYLKTRTLRNLVISTSILIGMVFIGGVVVLSIVFAGYLVNSNIQDGNIKKQGRELVSIEDLDKIVTISYQLEKIELQHGDKYVNSRLFDIMSSIIPLHPNEISISTLKLDPEEGVIYIEGTADNGYEALEAFKKTIKHTTIQVKEGKKSKKISLATNVISGETSFGEAADGQKVLRFSLSFNYPSELFEVSSGLVLVESPTGRVDVTDSLAGVPKSLFKPDAESPKEDEEE